MISPEKQAANQANAQHSTGPKTPEGMARSAANSRTHPLGDPQAGGFCSKDNLVAPEEQEEFDQMAHGYQIDLSPEGAIEQTLADEIVRRLATPPHGNRSLLRPRFLHRYPRR